MSEYPFQPADIDGVCADAIGSEPIRIHRT